MEACNRVGFALRWMPRRFLCFFQKIIEKIAIASAMKIKQETKNQPVPLTPMLLITPPLIIVPVATSPLESNSRKAATVDAVTNVVFVETFMA
jgi:hypothetical protein